jgi:hypothetical protein
MLFSPLAISAVSVDHILIKAEFSKYLGSSSATIGEENKSVHHSYSICGALKPDIKRQERAASIEDGEPSARF